LKTRRFGDIAPVNEKGCLDFHTQTILAEMGRARPEVLKTNTASMVDPSIVKAIDAEESLKRLK